MDDRTQFNQPETASQSLYLAAQLDPSERERVLLLPSLVDAATGAEADADVGTSADTNANAGTYADADIALDVVLDMLPAPTPDAEAAEQYFQHGKRLFEAGDLAGAVSAYRQALQWGQSADLYQHFAQALSQQGDLAEAASYYRKAIELSAETQAAAEPEPAEPPLPWFEEAAFQLQQGQAHLSRKNWQAAVTACEQAVQIMGPKTADAYSSLARALQAQGELDAAKGAFMQALHLQPKTAELHAYLGSVHAQQKQITEAMNCYRRAIALNPQFAGAYWEMAELWKQSGDRDQATDCWYRALQLEPSWGTAREHWQLGTTLAEQNKLEQAVQSYRQAIRIDPKFAEAYHNLGVILGKQNRWQDALQEHRQAIGINPDAPQFWAGLGRALVAHEAWEEAIVAYQKVTRLNLNEASYSIFQHALGQLEQCQKAMVAQSYAQMAENLAQQQKWREAVDCYEQAIERYPSSAQHYAGLGKALAGLEHWPEAIAAHQRAMELAPDNTSYYLAFGDLLIQREQTQKRLQLQAANQLHAELRNQLDHPDLDKDNRKINIVEADNLTLL